MTKQELIASAILGTAHIDTSASYIDYRITPPSDDPKEPIDYPLIVLSMRESDYSICENESYFTDGLGEDELTSAEAMILQQVIADKIDRAR